ncbi:PDR/VanB family oxidoreductase [Rhodococcus ruber]|uniref:PDR/VanB family oxidoreductase n=1 Tax=Rhodococcus ruber TaxID=1830 RepID=A0ABT4MEL6_9NOCA|nr:PDR/VanB family oxidoreductase [Rhodococcus ruber]MCZ4519434.1 PDR/VanB family oxidoreductase [Rhodococcus ruber]
MIEPIKENLGVLVSQMRWEAIGVASLTLTLPSGAALPEWEPGAHIELTTPSGLIRQFTLCGDSRDLHSYTIAVRLEEYGRGGSAELHRTALIGRELTISIPRNRFTLRDAAGYLFIAGGIGITPILTMATAVQRRSVAPWQAIYTGRGVATMAFSSQLQALRPESVTILDTAAGPRIDLKDQICHLPEGSVVYCCGPAGLIAAVTEICSTSSVQYEVERFHAEPAAPQMAGDSMDLSFVLELRRSGLTVPVPPGVTVLQAVRDAGVSADFSCEEGYCGTCEVTVLEGTPDHRDTVLSTREKAANTCMMACVSRSCSDTLVIDL